MKQSFKEVKFQAKTLALIGVINGILNEYAAMGFVLTIRQLYYQLVARDYIPNTMRDYKRLVRTAGEARLAGLVDWNAIVDRARQVIYPSHWDSPAKVVKSAWEAFRVDRWETQPNHVEIMIEKDALAGVLEETCEDLDIRLIPNRGYASLSMMWRHGRRMRWKDYDGKSLYLLYLGDHDPSGLDMDRDIVERIEMFSSYSHVYFERLALTMEQIEEHDPPPDPAKMSDSRAWGYIAEHGHESWELDALPPNILRDLVEDRVLELRDPDLYDETMEKETAMKDALQDFYEDIEAQEASGEAPWVD